MHLKGETAEVNCVLFAQIAGFAFKRCKIVRAHVLESYPKAHLTFIICLDGDFPYTWKVVFFSCMTKLKFCF